MSRLRISHLVSLAVLALAFGLPAAAAAPAAAEGTAPHAAERLRVPAVPVPLPGANGDTGAAPPHETPQ